MTVVHPDLFTVNANHVLDAEVDFVRFFCDEETGAHVVRMELTYKNGEVAVLYPDDDGGWRFADGGPPYDAATATGMYDR